MFDCFEHDLEHHILTAQKSAQNSFDSCKVKGVLDADGIVADDGVLIVTQCDHL
jgi:hypothetical protein